PPKMFRTSRSEINIFVNGRWVQPRSLLWSVQEAYSSLLMVGRHPIAALHVQVPPERLDVNVHPAKSEVRFANERAVTSLVGRTVRAALLGDSDSATSEDAPPVEMRQFELSSGEPARESAQWESPTQESWPIPTPHSVRVEADEPAALPPLRILGQMGATYIIAEGPAGMCLIDQHAAHERILLERFQAGVRVGQIESQALLEPTVIPLTRDQASRADELAAEIGALGFAVEAFGGDSLLVRSLPAGIPADRVEEVLTSLEEGVEGLDSIEERRRAMLASMACHAAIKAGQVLDMREMRALIADLERTRAPLACAHGRPTILELSRSDLEREFGRRGAISQSRRA
ncbi:MAG: DNA mismatch repair protein MutL, partial [Chloroflexia bacterium]